MDTFNALKELLIDLADTRENIFTPEIEEELESYEEILSDINDAWSGSFMGHHALIYIKGFSKKGPGEFFDSEWGTINPMISSSATRGDWVEYSKDGVLEEIKTRSKGLSDLDEIFKKVKIIEDKQEDVRMEALAVFGPTIEEIDSEELKLEYKKIKDHKNSFSIIDLLSTMDPKGSIMSRDTVAMAQGIIYPPHLRYMAKVWSIRSYNTQSENLIKIIKYIIRWIESKKSTTNKKYDLLGAKKCIFIAHGRSKEWLVLKEFIVDRLKLEYEEYNREPTAGMSRKERIEAMLGNSGFALSVMTAEDLDTEGKLHPRENVIHEAGLSQGKLGFNRSIILLEEGCEEFSNIHGLDQIRFPKGNIAASFEEIRKVLEREGLV